MDGCLSGDLIFGYNLAKWMDVLSEVSFLENARMDGCLNGVT